MTGSRIRTVLVTVPIGVALPVLLVVGVFAPEIVDPGPGPAFFRRVVLVVGAGTMLVIGVAAARTAGRVRLSWVALALMAGLWTLSVLGGLSGQEPALAWGWLRVGVVLTGTAALLLAPGTRRSPREWGLVALDGWLVGGSVFVIGWVGLVHTGSLPTTGAAQHPAAWWIGPDLVLASVTAGLAMRTADAARVPSVLSVLVALLAVTGDTTWMLTGVANFAVVQWVIAMVALAGAATWSSRPPWQAGGPVTAPQLLRWSQVAAVPGMMAAITCPFDPVVVVAAASVVLVTAAEIVLVSRQNQHLWEALHAQARRLDEVVRDSRDAIVQVDARGVVEFTNEAVAEVLGWPSDALLGARVGTLVHPDDLPGALHVIRRLDDRRGASPSVRVTARARHADGGWRYVEATVSRRTGQVPGFAVLARDVGDRVQLQAELHRLACTDTLTGLANRHAFLTMLTQRLAAAPAAVLFVDLDGFKAVNDVLGHAAGDALLCEVAQAVLGVLGPDDVAARLGGDEFAVLAGQADPASVDALARRITEDLSRLQAAATVPVSASVGVAVAGGGSAEALLRDADLAMYEAKSAGGGRRVRYEPGMRQRVTEAARRRAALEAACRDGGHDLRLDVQPIVAMDGGTWAGFEALVRWQDGEHLRYPDAFLPLAEESGLVVLLGDQVLRSALGWLAGWPDPTAGISVNVAAAQVAAPGFGERVVAALEAAGVAPHRLTLEVTEQTAVDDLQRAGAVLQPLRALGVHVSLDDFGTGFSSLGYLAQLPVDELKIDRRFVAGLGQRPEDDALVRAVTGLAADLGLRVVAEGVETPEQARRLLARGCLLGQGHYFLPPVPASRLHRIERTVPMPEPAVPRA